MTTIDSRSLVNTKMLAHDCEAVLRPAIASVLQLSPRDLRELVTEPPGLEVNSADKTIAQTQEIMGSDPDVLSLLVAGSAVSGELDAWSDVDFVMIVCDHALDKYYSDVTWLGNLGPVYAFKRSATDYRRMVRACLQDLRRLDLIIVADSKLIQYLERPGPLHGDTRMLFSRRIQINEALACLRPHKPLPHADINRYRQMDEAFWWDAVLTVVKVARGDCLSAGLLALELVQSCITLHIMLRDRETGTCHHRHGSYPVPTINLPANLSPARILGSVEQTARQWDELAKKWDPSKVDKHKRLLELMHRVVPSVGNITGVSPCWIPIPAVDV